jgi:hypothetical protein
LKIGRLLKNHKKPSGICNYSGGFSILESLNNNVNAMKLKFLILFLLSFTNSFGKLVPELRHSDKIRIREAITISTLFGDKLFKGFNSSPFAMILVTDSTEFLLNHPNPSSDFKLLGFDEFLGVNVYHRKTQFNTRFLATFPAVNGISCIVVGTPENTKRNSTEWVITILHERLHQYQTADPDYYKSVNELNLSGNDPSGMWMLNYPFPYDSTQIIDQYELYTKALHDAITCTNRNEFKSYLNTYFVERDKLKKLLSDPDYRYFSFQIWQEGLAKNTEYKFLEVLENYTPSKEMVELDDFMSFQELKSKMYKRELTNLLQNKLYSTKRDSFYSVGFAEGILLDKLNKSWRKRYLIDKFYIEKYSKKYI